MSVVERIKQRDPSPSAWLFSKSETAKHAATRGVAGATAVPVVLAEYPTRIAVGTVGAIKRAAVRVTSIEQTAKGDPSPSAWLLKKAVTSERAVTKTLAGVSYAGTVLVEFPLRAVIGTAGAVKRATERVTRLQ